jgi:hypothetical protein
MTPKPHSHSRSLSPIAVFLSLALVTSLGCALTGVLGGGGAPTSTPAMAIELPTAGPTETPPPPATAAPPAPTQPAVNFHGVSFSYDPALAGFVNADVIPAVTGEDEPPWMLAPEHLEFSFVDYILADTFHAPAIYVYPTAEYAAISEAAGEVVDALRALLAEKPADPEGSIPFLPPFNAGQFMHAAVKYVDFQNGSGVRFLTQYGQAVWPVNNQDMFYTYQGLTSDGAYYVAAVLPASHPSLPATGDEVAETQDYDAFSENFQSYLADVTADLSAQDPASFTPSLTSLDSLAASIQITGW